MHAKGETTKKESQTSSWATTSPAFLIILTGSFDYTFQNIFVKFQNFDSFGNMTSMVNEMVNCPHWVPMKCYINGKLASFVDEMQGGNKEGGLMDQKWEILSHERILDMKKAALYRRTSFKDPSDGRITHLETLRFKLLFFDNS